MRRAASSLFSALFLGCAGLAQAAGGTLQDQAVSLVYTSAHWGPAPNAFLYGTDAGTSSSPLFRSGWFYRVEGVDTREYPFPPPDTETYGSDGKLVATWSNVDGKGFAAQEITWVFDDEGPSGGLVSRLDVNWGSNPVHGIALFHFLDVDVGGSYLNDSALLRGRGYIKISDGPSTIRYKGFYVQHYRVAPYDNTYGGDIKRRLNDTAIDNLDDSGLPFGPGDVTAAFQFSSSGTYGGGQVVISSNVARDYVRGQGDALGATPEVLMHSNLGANYERNWAMRRTRAMESWSGYTYDREFLAENDFDGDGWGDGVTRTIATGALWIGDPLSGAASPPPNWQLAATADFDGDGKADLLWRNLTSQKLTIWLMNGAAKVGGRVPSPDHAADANWSVVGAADFNNDGNHDLLFYNQTSGNLVIWTLDANQVRITGAFTNPASVGSNTWKAVAVGDWGRGAGGTAPWGSPDILWQNDVSKKLVVWHMDFAGNRTSGTFTTPDVCTDCGPVYGPR